MHVNARAIIERWTPDESEIVVQVRNKPYEGGKWIELPDLNSTSENMPNKPKRIPSFASEDEEREFWDSHDSTEYVDWDAASSAVFPHLTTRHASALRFAVCIDNSEYPVSLEIHKVYRVLSDPDAERDGDLRVIDESGEDYLFPKTHFVLLDLPDNSVISH